MIPTLPEGARLALLNWPGGQPTARALVEAAEPDAGQRLSDTREIINPLLQGGWIERLPERVGGYTVFRLTQAGRKAVDVLQSGVE